MAYQITRNAFVVILLKTVLNLTTKIFKAPHYNFLGMEVLMVSNYEYKVSFYRFAFKGKQTISSLWK